MGVGGLSSVLGALTSCLFNDVAVAIRVLQAEGRLARALVVDLDVHQGDGTARLFEKVPGVFTLSMHAARNFQNWSLFGCHTLAPKWKTTKIDQYMVGRVQRQDAYLGVPEL